MKKRIKMKQLKKQEVKAPTENKVVGELSLQESWDAFSEAVRRNDEWKEASFCLFVNREFGHIQIYNAGGNLKLISTNEIIVH